MDSGNNAPKMSSCLPEMQLGKVQKVNTNCFIATPQNKEVQKSCFDTPSVGASRTFKMGFGQAELGGTNWARKFVQEVGLKMDADPEIASAV